MRENVDREVLSCFVAEAKSYLPEILQAIRIFHADPSQPETLAEAYRYAHIIHGAASLVGLPDVSNMAAQLESSLELLVSGQAELTDEMVTQLCHGVMQVAEQLNEVANNTSVDSTQSLDHVSAQSESTATQSDSVPVEFDLVPKDSIFSNWDNEQLVAPPDNLESISEQINAQSEPQEPVIERPVPDLTSMPEMTEMPSFDSSLITFPDASSMMPEFPDIPIESEHPKSIVDAELKGNPTLSPYDPALKGNPTLSQLVLTPAEDVSLELAEVFNLEAEEHLRSMTAALQTLERHPERRDLMQTIRRSAHSLKGSAAMVGYREITTLAHRMEDLLDLIYDGDRPVTQEIVQMLFAATYALEDMTNGQATNESIQALYVEFKKLLDATAEVAPSVLASIPALANESAQDGNVVSMEHRLPPVTEESIEEAQQNAAASSTRTGQIVRVPLERLDELVRLVSELVIAQTSFEQGMTDFGKELGELHSSSARLRRVSSKLETQYEASALGGGRSILPVVPSHGGVPNSLVTFNTHGFDALEFDRYTEFHLLSRELTETTSDLFTVGSEFNNLSSDFDSYLGRQSRLFSEIQDRLMRIRMVPLSTIASRLHRIVRHVSNKQGKQVELLLEGDDTGLDKTVLEEIVDPLQHLLRNAVDHGIEPPSAREAMGKPARGRIRLRAYYEGTQVVIQLSDDGRGLDPEKIRTAAVSGGFVAASDVPEMSDKELFALCFLPGFSTSPQISEISGRGVGLDVVQDAVHKLKGTVTLGGGIGKGAIFTIRLPMTLAVIKALFVNAGNQTYAIPLSVVTQILRLERGTIEEIGRESVLRVNNKVYPLMWLSKLLNIKQVTESPVARPPVLIINVEGRQIALVVDEMFGGREVVIKNLANHLRGVQGVMGATLMGDGSVVLILNVADFVRDSSRSSTQQRAGIMAPAQAKRETMTIMIVDDSPSVRRVSTNLVKNAGWQPVQAKDGLEALEILHHSDILPDLMLLDIEMPRMDGYELLSTLRAQPAYRNLPVVVVTSRASEKHRQKAFAVGATEYLVKPYQDEMLLSLIRRLVRESRRALA